MFCRPRPGSPPDLLHNRAPNCPRTHSGARAEEARPPAGHVVATPSTTYTTTRAMLAISPCLASNPLRAKSAAPGLAEAKVAETVVRARNCELGQRARGGLLLRSACADEAQTCRRTTRWSGTQPAGLISN